MTPISKLTSVRYAFQRPWLTAVLLGRILLAGVGVGLLAGRTYDVFNKRFTVGFIAASGLPGGFSFQPSVLESPSITEASAAHVHRILVWLIEGKPAAS